MRDQLLVEREKTHGDFKTTAEISQRTKCLFDEFNNELCIVQREALDMIAVKIARILSGDPHHEEHWLDIIGYARLGLEACRPCAGHAAGSESLEHEQEPGAVPDAVLTGKES